MTERPSDRQRKFERRGRVADRRRDDRRGADYRRSDRRVAERRTMWCGVCRMKLTPQGYCSTCRVRVVILRP